VSHLSIYLGFPWCWLTGMVKRVKFHHDGSCLVVGGYKESLTSYTVDFIS
jgi:hypothetical protein